ncbi:MAG: hypothetical protein QOC89_2268, partial [Paraburkholderia sp.]|nr:hypothetical protein [Paraburkholderia sp.]
RISGIRIVAAFALAAAGVQMGSAFMACPETAVSALHREAQKNASVWLRLTLRIAKSLTWRFSKPEILAIRNFTNAAIVTGYGSSLFSDNKV